MKPKHNNKNKRFFNTWEFEQAYNIFHNLHNPIDAKFLFEEYLKKYPKDYLAYTYYISVLITLGEFEKAEKHLNSLKFLFNNKQLSFETDKLYALERRIIANTLRLLAYQEKFEELYQYYLINQNKINHIDKDMNLNHIVFYCKFKLGKLDSTKRAHKTYLFRQIIKYDYNDFLAHIKKHLADFNQHVNISNQSIFVPDFPLEKVLDEIKKLIPSDKKLYTGFFENSYIFKYDECGKDYNKLTNYFKVVCFHNTNNIITIYPSIENNYVPFIDLNYLKENNDKPLVRRLSQTEKFNLKYKRY